MIFVIHVMKVQWDKINKEHFDSDTIYQWQ